MIIIYQNQHPENRRSNHYYPDTNNQANVEKSLFIPLNNDSNRIENQNGTMKNAEKKNINSNYWFITINNYPYEVKN